jgi:hypothetical protein
MEKEAGRRMLLFLRNLKNQKVRLKNNLMSFKKVQAKIAKKSGVSKKAAGAILASASRNASAKAKKKNPKLKKVKGRSKK